MDYSTGLPQISIPLYEVKSGSLSVPISISYHASGCKVSDRDGPVVVGWSLVAGGMISRTIHGDPDFGIFPFPSPFETIDLTNRDDLGYFENIMHFDKDSHLTSRGYWTDSQYDIFSYSFGGDTGKFIFKDEDGAKTLVLIPHKPYQIKPLTSVNPGGIEVIDDKGTYYFFSGWESIDGKTTGYSLEQMISADKTDTISFVYSAFTQERISRSQQILLKDEYSPYGTEISQTSAEITNRETYQISRLTEIHFNNGKVIFN